MEFEFGRERVARARELARRNNNEIEKMYPFGPNLKRNERSALYNQEAWALKPSFTPDELWHRILDEAVIGDEAWKTEYEEGDI